MAVAAPEVILTGVNHNLWRSDVVGRVERQRLPWDSRTVSRPWSGPMTRMQKVYNTLRPLGVDPD